MPSRSRTSIKVTETVQPRDASPNRAATTRPTILKICVELGLYGAVTFVLDRADYTEEEADATVVYMKTEDAQKALSTAVNEIQAKIAEFMTGQPLELTNSGFSIQAKLREIEKDAKDIQGFDVTMKDHRVLHFNKIQ